MLPAIAVVSARVFSVTAGLCRGIQNVGAGSLHDECTPTNQKDKPMSYFNFYRTTTIVTPNNYNFSSFTFGDGSVRF